MCRIDQSIGPEKIGCPLIGRKTRRFSCICGAPVQVRHNQRPTTRKTSTLSISQQHTKHTVGKLIPLRHPMDASDVEFTAGLDGHEEAGEGRNGPVGSFPTQQHNGFTSSSYTELPPVAEQSPSSPGATLEAPGNNRPVDFSTALPGADHFGHGASGRHPHFEPFVPARSTKHGLERAAAAAASTGKGLAASARRTVVSGLGVLTGAAADSATTVDDGYVAMSTPCESPVHKVTGTTPGADGFPHAPSSSSSSSTALPFKPSASSRAGLAARLGSALHSWTSSSGRGRGGSGGTGGDSHDSAAGPPREGRPGPLGAKYTQPHRRSESPEPGAVPRYGREERGDSAFEPSPYQQLSDGPSEAPEAPAGSALAPAAAAWGRGRRASEVEEGTAGSADRPAASAPKAGAAGAGGPSTDVRKSNSREVLLIGVDGGAPECDHDTAAGSSCAEPPPATGVAQRGGEDDEAEEREGLEEEEEGQEAVEGEEEEVAEDEDISGREKEALEGEEGDGEGRPVPDMIMLEPEASRAPDTEKLLIQLPEAPTPVPVPAAPAAPATVEDQLTSEPEQASAPAIALENPPSSTPSSGAGEQGTPQQQVDGGAEAGAGSERTAPSADHGILPPAAAQAAAAQAAAPSGAPHEEEASSEGRAERRGRGKENNPINGAPNGNEKRRKKRAAGLWELKAERGRVEHALVEAENERDVQRARAVEAADRLEEAIARLEELRQRLGVDGGGGTAGVA